MADSHIDEALHKVMERRAEKVPPLSDGFVEKVLGKMEAAHLRPHRGGEKKSLLSGRFGSGRWLLGIAASILLLIALNIRQQRPESKPVVAEVTATPENTIVEDTTRHDEKNDTLLRAKRHVAQGKATRRVRQNDTSRPNPPATALAEETLPKESTPLLTTAADSLEYYVARLEREMEAIDDSLYMESIEQLMKVDVRLQRMVEQLVGKQVETAMQHLETYDTTLIITF